MHPLPGAGRVPAGAVLLQAAQRVVRLIAVGARVAERALVVRVHVVEQTLPGRVAEVALLASEPGGRILRLYHGNIAIWGRNSALLYGTDLIKR